MYKDDCNEPKTFDVTEDFTDIFEWFRSLL